MQYRDLTEREINSLIANECTAESWDNIRVTTAGFNTEHIRQVNFSGSVRLGAFKRVYELSGGFKKQSGLYNTNIHNCTIGNNVLIDNVHNYIGNYIVEDDVYIENTNIIIVDRKTSFGNGTRVSVIHETGGRELPIFNELSAPLAYILTMYRHRPAMIEQIVAQIDAYVEKESSDVGVIGHNSIIINCGQIKNMKIGPYTRIKGTSNLQNGTINSNEKAPVLIGSGVKAENFILSSGVKILDSTLLFNCFVGQGSMMDKHYSATDSAFFANCQGMHGEANSIFAGPFTVSHHKSTLLIAGMFSFLNAGSGSNQSNHMYKLGPIHQGIVERGSKTTSDSYILWPAKVGAFTLVMGRHTSHLDSSDLPFSYLIEDASESILVPAVNLRSIGTIRDAQKWPKRDNRTDDHLLDPINYNLLSPYTIHKMCNGVKILENLLETSGATSDFYSYHNCKIKNSALKKGLMLYKMVIHKFLGNSLISKIEKELPENIQDLYDKLDTKEVCGLGDWVDMAGMIAPKNEVNKILDQIEFDAISLKEINEQLNMLHKNYYDLEWQWAKEKLEVYWGKPITEVSREELIAKIELWRDSVVKLDQMLYEDARKEFNLAFTTGFGKDGNIEEKTRDFESVRGKFDQNPLVCEVLSHIDRKTELGNRTIKLLQDL